MIAFVFLEFQKVKKTITIITTTTTKETTEGTTKKPGMNHSIYNHFQRFKITPIVHSCYLYTANSKKVVLPTA